jgi:hypothetical protein
MIGYYLPQFNFSVRFYNGQWCQFCRQSNDVVAVTQDQINAVLMWANINTNKFN